MGSTEYNDPDLRHGLTKSQGYPVRGGVREEGGIALDSVDTKEIERWGGRTWKNGWEKNDL